MSASPGRSLLLRVNTTGSTFVTAGGLRSKQVKRAVAKVDVTTADSAGRWQELLPGAAPQSLSFSASDFVWLNDTAYQAFRTAFEGGTHADLPDRLSGLGLLPGQLRHHAARRDGAARQGDLLRADARELRRAGLDHGSAGVIRSAPCHGRRTAINTLRGEFEAAHRRRALPLRHDARHHRGDRGGLRRARRSSRSLNGVVFGRRAADQIALIAAALAAGGPSAGRGRARSRPRPPWRRPRPSSWPSWSRSASRSRRDGEGGGRGPPLAGAAGGGAGASSRSAA